MGGSRDKGGRRSRIGLWNLLHEAAGWIKSYQLGTGDQLYERITKALDGEPICEGKGS